MKNLPGPLIPLSAATLDRYLYSIQQAPLLSEEEEYALAKQMHAQQSLNAVRRLALSHLRLVAHIARSYLGYGLPQADLIQEGNIGLLKAIRHFNPEKRARLATFAIHWIRAEIVEFILQNWRLVKVATTKAQRKLFFNLRRLKPATGSMKATDVSRIAPELDVPERDVTEMDQRLSGTDFSLSAPGDHAEANTFELPAETAGPGDALAESELGQRQAAALRKALAALDARSRHIIEARWLKDGKKTTLQELATVYGLTAEGVRKAEQRSLQQLRLLMGAPAREAAGCR